MLKFINLFRKGQLFKLQDARASCFTLALSVLLSAAYADDGIYFCSNVWSNAPCGHGRANAPVSNDDINRRRRQGMVAEVQRLAAQVRAETGQDTLSAESLEIYCAKDSTTLEICETRAIKLAKELLADLKAHRKHEQRARELQQRKDELVFRREKLHAELQRRRRG